WVVMLSLLVMASGAWAEGWSETYSLAGGMVGVTNSQANSSWVPVSVMWKFPSPFTGTAEVWRVSQTESYLLSRCNFRNATTVVWVPDVHYPFGPGETLVLRSSVTNGVVQVIRKGD
ncbi:MAG: hypothetical protein NTV49_04405, partial [Kiritimatiellaeota bacterium]|nr:hypothetical protein [Kiritimatiellota bacterium]